MTSASPLSPDADAAFAGMLAASALVIFDFDGVVADSEVLSLASLQAALAGIGIERDLDWLRVEFLGTSLKTITAFVAEQAPDASLEAFADAWEGALFERFRRELHPVRGLAPLLDRLDAAGTPYCIGSSGTFERIEIALEAMALSGRFAHVFSAQLVARGKPAPDLFLHAAEAMAVAPAECLVIEDSPYGVAAAKAAGMRCVGFVGGAHLVGLEASHGTVLHRSGADLVVASLDGSAGGGV